MCDRMPENSFAQAKAMQHQYEGSSEASKAAARRALGPVSRGGIVQFGEACLVAKASHPHECLAGNSAFTELTGFRTEDFQGSALKVLQDGSTHAVWESAIEAALKGGAHYFQVLCNTASCKQLQLRVRATALRPSEEEGVRLIAFVMACDDKTNPGGSSPCDEARACAVVKNKAPFHVESVSAGWSRMYRVPEAAVLGRSLKVVQGPGTDMRAVNQLMEAGAQGAKGQETFVTYDIEGRRFWSHHTTSPCGPESFAVEVRPRAMPHATVHFVCNRVRSHRRALQRMLRVCAPFSCHFLTASLLQVYSTEIIDLKDALQTQKGLALLVAADRSDGEISIAHASDELCKLLGKDSKNEAGQAAASSKLLATTSKEALLKTTRDVTSGKPCVRSVLLAFSCEDARMICARASGKPVADTSLVMTHVLYTLELLDIEMLSAAIASLDNTDTAELIASTKVPFSIKHASPAWCRLYGLTTAEVSGRSMQFVNGPLTDQRAIIRMFNDAVTGQHGRDLLTCYHKEGTAVTAMMTICPLMADNGAVDHVRVVVNPTSAGAPAAKLCSPINGQLSPPEASLSCTATKQAARICPEGRITHLNGRTQLVLYPTADPAVKHCLVYLDMLRDASIVSKWEWEGDALKVDFDSHKVLARTQKSSWCRMWTADLRTWHAWWNRMLWIISDASRNSPEPYHATCGADVAPLAAACSGPTLSALIRVDGELCLSGMTSSVCIVDTHSRVVFANSAFLRMMRYSSYQLLGAPLFGLCAKSADEVEVSRVKFCLQSCTLDRRQLSTCLLLRKGDGSTLWASVLGEPVPLTDYEISDTYPHKGTAMPARGMAWRTCMLMSIEDSSDIVSPSSPSPAALVNEPHEENNLADVNDPYVVQMAQELAVMQDQTVAEWKDALASLHGSMLTPTPQVAGEGTPCVSSSDKAASRDDCQKILVQITGDMSRLGVVEALWQLKTQGQIKAWRWECDFLSLTIKADSLRPCAALVAARLLKRGGGRLGFRCLDDADLLRAGTWQQRIACLVHSTLQDGVLASEADVPGASLHAALLAREHSALHPSRHEAAKLAEPGIDFDFLTVADGGVNDRGESEGDIVSNRSSASTRTASPMISAAVQRHAKKQQVRQAQAAAQHSALRVSAAAKATAPHIAQALAAERRQVERLEELLEQEVIAKLNANASALAASAQNELLWREVKRLEERVDTQDKALEAKAQALQSIFVQQEIERSVSSVALKTMESSLHRKTCEIESLLARMAQLTDETQTLRGMLELGASSSDNPGSSSSDTQGSSSRGVCM